MNDTVTFITSATNNQIVKSFRGPDSQQLKFSPGSEFLVSQNPVHDLQSLASVISGLEDDPTKAVMRGLPLLPENCPVARQSRNFSTTSRHWIPSSRWNTPKQTVRFCRTTSDCWYHFSSSMSIKAGIRVHLWYWLDRPCSG